MLLMTVADIIQRRVALSAREAAALTLAVAGEWDRQRAIRGPISVPEAGGITLQPEGRVSFLVSLPVAGVDDAAALSGLFSQLLGIEETRPAARADVADGKAERQADGQVVTVTAASSTIEMGATTVAAFRAALARFGDENPEVLAALFSRASMAMQQPAAERAVRDSTAARRTPDRRRVPDAVTDLRRDLRGFEQQVFEARGSTPPEPVPVAERVTHRVRPMWMAAACAVAIVLGVGITAVTGRPASTTAPVAPAAPAAADGADLRQRIGDVALTSAAPLRQPVAQVTKVTAPAAARNRRQPATAKVPARRPLPPPTFAGGARTITWMAASR